VQQLGLRLEARKAPIETIVLEHVEEDARFLVETRGSFLP